MKTTIYHNPRCTKSRLTLGILEEKNIDFEVIKYLETPPTFAEMKALLGELKLDAKSFMRTFEAVYKEQNLDNTSLSEDDLIQAMVDYPILIERPIVKTDKGIAIGRPPENILQIL